MYKNTIDTLTSFSDTYLYITITFALCKCELKVRRNCELLRAILIMATHCSLSFVCLSSVTFVHPTQAIEIFGNVSTPFGTLAIC